MDYREFRAPDSLRRHVQCIWHLQDAAQPGRVQTIYPDGRCELIAHFGAAPRACDLDLRWHQQAPLLFAAQHRTAIRLMSGSAIDCLGVRLRPAASAALAGAKLPALRDRAVDLHEIHPEFARHFADAATSFAADPTDARLWTLLEKWLPRYRVDDGIEAAVAHLEAKDGRRRIESTAAVAAMGLRTFQVKFLAAVGLTAKEFAQLLRLQATIRKLDQDGPSLSDLALSSGFSDQAHATRELRRVTGVTPANLRAALRRDRNSDATVRLAAAFVRGHA